MPWKHLLLNLVCASRVATASIPQHKAQQPLLPAHGSSESEVHNVKVVLAFTESGSEMEQLAEIPLNTAVVSGTNLPSHLSTIEIVMAFTTQDRSVPLEQLDRIMCKITAKTDIEEQKATADAEMSDGLSWFMLNDGSLRLEDTASRWFLGGRAIESIECR